MNEYTKEELEKITSGTNNVKLLKKDNESKEFSDNLDLELKKFQNEWVGCRRRNYDESPPKNYICETIEQFNYVMSLSMGSGDYICCTADLWKKILEKAGVENET
jgi:hypothetical protein